jgi:threonine synthase
MAARVAIPDARFVGAVNRNRALLRWLASGIVDAEAETVATPSTAMDVGRPSNLERLVWLGQGTPGGLRERVSGEGVDDEATLSTIRDVHERHGVLICPHTAVGVAAARARVRAGEGGPYIVLATAHAGKFAEVVVEATGRAPELPPRLARLEGRAERIVPLAAASPEAGHRELARLLEEGRSA